ncbi:hypothetical protein K402DRAFT_459715 [Aulographum hederae CBS 113979]|uniref:Uncharacterized protein n=1 Tax=Aulographum hederae CBS 113979 TaxID=1176131 RepID=A0A6G1HD43_9PEZI|nr:hypothetical protein K402DRAFT_459715 [Aulographum hederae CBS 113979]
MVAVLPAASAMPSKKWKKLVESPKAEETLLGDDYGPSEPASFAAAVGKSQPQKIEPPPEPGFKPDTTYKPFYGPDETREDCQQWYNDLKEANVQKRYGDKGIVRRTYDELAYESEIRHYVPDPDYKKSLRLLIKEHLKNPPRSRSVQDVNLSGLRMSELVGSAKFPGGQFGKAQEMVKFLVKENAELVKGLGDLGGSEVMLKCEWVRKEHMDVEKLMRVEPDQVRSMAEADGEKGKDGEERVRGMIEVLREARERLLDDADLMEKETARLAMERAVGAGEVESDSEQPVNLLT